MARLILAVAVAGLAAACSPPPDSFAGAVFVQGVTAYRQGDLPGVERAMDLITSRPGDEAALAAARKLGLLLVAAGRTPALSPEARFLYAEQLCEPPSWVDLLASIPPSTPMPLMGERDPACLQARPVMRDWRAALAAASPAPLSARLAEAERVLARRGMVMQAPWVVRPSPPDRQGAGS